MISVALVALSLSGAPVAAHAAPVITEVRYRRRSHRRARRAASDLDGCCWPTLNRPKPILSFEGFYDLFPAFRGKP